MASILISSPHLVAELLEPCDIEQNIMLMDIFGVVEGERWLAEITVIFNPIILSRNHGASRADFYIGSTGALVRIDLEKNGDFKDWTRALSVDTETKIHKTLKKGVKVALKPAIGIKKDAKVSPGELSGDIGKEMTQESTFEIKEYPLEPKKIGRAIEWMIKMPKGYKAVRDFLYGNILLSAEVQWEKVPHSGSFTLRTSDIRFFDDQGEPLSKIQTLAMRFLMRNKICLQNRDGLTFKFEINE